MSYDVLAVLHYILSEDATLAAYTDSQIHRGSHVLQDDKLLFTQHCAIFVPMELSERLEPWLGNTTALNHTLFEVSVVAKRDDGETYGLSVARRVRNVLNAFSSQTYNGETAQFAIFNITITPQWEEATQYYRFIVRGYAHDAITLS